MHDSASRPTSIVTINRDDSIQKAAALMLSYNVGCLIVNNDDGDFVGVVSERDVARRVALVWGTQPVLMENDVTTHDEVVLVVDQMLVENDLARPGDTIVILMGDPIRERPLTNLMRVHRVLRKGDRFEVSYPWDTNAPRLLNFGEPTGFKF